MSMDTAAAQANGVILEEEVFVDFWGFSDTQRHYLGGQGHLPEDRRQYFLIQRMTEGDKARYQREIRSDVTVVRQTGDAKLKSDPATERHALLKACVVGWNMKRRNERGEIEDVPFSKSSGKLNFESWLAMADPRLVEDLEKSCRKLNPWLLADISVEDIDKQIADLQEMREEAAKREAGEADSSSK